ncbi:hypothetical protein V6N13_027229 [Hibiscus sabdariffa]
MEADKEELFWEQRARVNWLQQGDKNTPFFHSYASFRRRKNEVKGLLDDQGDGDGRVRTQGIDIYHTTVADLIDQSEKVWKLDILRELFEEDQVERICSIPITRGTYVDDIIWRLEGSGCYTVKSGYRLLQNASPAIASHISGFFTAVWSVELPPKVRIIMWRVANNFLPTYDNLQRRRLVVSNICPFCDSPGETVVHLMRDCALSNQPLAAFNLGPSHVLGEEPWIDWLASFFLNLSVNDRRL